MTVRTFAYGPDPSQRGDLHLPVAAGPLPVVIVIHGGYWRARYGRDLGSPLAADLTRFGVAAWNIEYRRVGGGGGWPETFLDVAAAVDALAQLPARDLLDLDKVAVVGHSAGGQLAIWVAGRAVLPAGVPGATPAVVVRGAVSQAGVLDLIGGYAQWLSNGAVAELLGGSPAEVPDRYGWASPLERVPLGVPATLVHGDADDLVPIEQSERYAQAAEEAGDQIDFVRLPGVEHFAVIDPSTAAWAVCRDAALRYVGR
jgi:acetyl esterase/lipase